MTQPSLLDLTPVPVRRLPPFQRGSATSKAAAERARSFVGPQGERLYAHYVACGTFGCTDAEAELSIPMKRQSVIPRRRALEQAGRVRKTDVKRGKCAVYQVVGL